MPSAQQHREKLIDLLKQLFQLDQPELDFGLYKIMHAKSEQVLRFLENDLLEEIEQAFESKDNVDAKQLKQQARVKLTEALGEGALDERGNLQDAFKNIPAGIKYLEEMAAAEAAKDIVSAESEVYDHLYRFFERYYDAGDFMSRRYYARESDSRAAPYSVPYDGREVYLHWANKDQYYIKSSEYLSNYTFELNEAVSQEAKRQKSQKGKKTKHSEAFDFDTEISDKPLIVHFRIVGASEGEHGNIKSVSDQKRFFIIHHETPVLLENDELIIQFQYRTDPEKTGQDKKWQDTRLQQAEESIVEALTADKTAAVYLKAFQQFAPTDKQKQRTLLGKYLQKYAARNTMDYFIHKDLGGFMRRELDFYIKNEIMRLDDIENADVPKVEQYLGKIRVLRRIAHQLITFIAQLEDFQKKLWLKKKFVTETNYCITLDRVPEKFYEEIAANDKQREEWVKLFAIDEIKAPEDQDLLGSDVVDYSESLSVEFLKANPFLLIDTALFDGEFKQRLLAEITELDVQCDGILLHSDNFHGLSLLQRKFSNSIKSVYLDPPYNTDVSAIPYKNSYRHSSWATLMNDRLRLIQRLMLDASACYVSIDKHERRSLEAAMDIAFGEENKVEELIWAQNTNDGRSPTFSTNHEYIEVYSKNITAAEEDYSLFREPKPGFEEVMQLITQLNPDYPSCEEIQDKLRELYNGHKKELKEKIEKDGLSWNEEKRNDPWNGAYQYKYAEYRDINGCYIDEVEAKSKNAQIWIFNPSDWTIMESDRKQSSTTKDPDHPNYRYYQPLHPITNKPCKMPSRGWKGTLKIDPTHPKRNSWESQMADHRIWFGKDENNVPRQKKFLHEVDTNVAKSVIVDYSDGEKETSALFGRKGVFLAPKHTNFVSKFVLQSTRKNSFVLDIFGGSGSTGGAVINCNKVDQLGRKYILMEANEYIDTIIVPRLKKTVYASSWSGGKPSSHDGISHCFKYLRLESYEDAVNNLDLQSDGTRDAALVNNTELQRDYLLNYFLDVETEGSQSLLNITDFRDPTAYKMFIKKPGSEESRLQTIDLIETFNWLIGLWVDYMAAPQCFTAEFEREKDADLPEDQNTRLICKRLKTESKGDYWFRLIEGYTLKVPGDNTSKIPTLIVWRKQTDDAEKDNAVLQKYLMDKLDISPREQTYEVIYINGSHTLPNPVIEGEQTKVRLIEEAFFNAMWAGESA
jgi:adenine-specific DNA-methyltransferase